jgi:hypothetical protein
MQAQSSHAILSYLVASAYHDSRGFHFSPCFVCWAVSIMS